MVFQELRMSDRGGVALDVLHVHRFGGLGPQRILRTVIVVASCAAWSGSKENLVVMASNLAMGLTVKRLLNVWMPNSSRPSLSSDQERWHPARMTNLGLSQKRRRCACVDSRQYEWTQGMQ